MHEKQAFSSLPSKGNGICLKESPGIVGWQGSWSLRESRPKAGGEFKERSESYISVSNRKLERKEKISTCKTGLMCQVALFGINLLAGALCVNQR